MEVETEEKQTSFSPKSTVDLNDIPKIIELKYMRIVLSSVSSD